MNTDNFLIEEKDLEIAQDICKTITDSDVRNRAVANAVAANIASRFFDSEQYNVDIESGLHNIGPVLEDIDIADIYINNCYIDVRIYFNDEELSVPKAHFDNNLLPAAYMFVKLNDDLSGGTVMGFIAPENIDRNDEAEECYPVNYNSLVSFYDIESRLIETDDNYGISDSDIFAYLDGALNDKNGFYSALLKSGDGRLRLAKAIKAQYIFNFISVPNENKIQQEDFSDNSDTLLELENLADESSDLNLNFDVVEDKTEDENQSASFTYTTRTTPGADKIFEEDKVQLTEEMLADKNEPENETDSAKQINTLFNNSADEAEENENTVEDFRPVKSKKSILLPIVGLLVVLGAFGYYGYNRLSSPPQEDEPQTNSVTRQAPAKREESAAMPVETLNNETPVNTQEEGIAESIPAIEQNLDASILVSNLKVNWEVPEGYASNTSAKRYLVKLGKIIQLNLKTELLLLNKPPITNKIAVEIKYNPNNKKFETGEVITSSGEKTVDDLILQTVSKALAMNLSINTDSFNKLQGNPVLVIHL